MTPQHPIYIIGAGAIGKVLAVLLKREQRDLVIIRAGIDHLEAYTEKIEVELNDTETVIAEIGIRTLSSFSILNGLVLITNKSFGNPSLATALKTKISNTPIVILQNGLNVEQPFLDQHFPGIYRAVLFATSQPIAKNKFRFIPVAASPVGIVKGNTQTLQATVEKINTSNFQFTAEENIRPLIWTKTIVNSVFNSVCPLLETDNGIFYRNEKARHIAKRIIAEGVVMATANGIALHEEEVLNRLLLISKISGGQLISTYQDLLNKRRTEIEALNLAIAGIAAELNKADMVKEINLLGELIKLKSELLNGP